MRTLHTLRGERLGCCYALAMSELPNSEKVREGSTVGKHQRRKEGPAKGLSFSRFPCPVVLLAHLSVPEIGDTRGDDTARRVADLPPPPQSTTLTSTAMGVASPQENDRVLSRLREVANAPSRHPLNLACGFAMLSSLSQ
jgi:hypothetical protein